MPSPSRAPHATPAPAITPRQRLLDAADKLFYSRGIRSTGVDAILEDAGVARNTLYYQFGGKEGLIVEYLRDRDARWRRHWDAIVEATADPLERVLAIFNALERWEPGSDRARGCAFVDANVELADPAHPAGEVVRQHWQSIETRLQSLAAEAGLHSPSAVARDLLMVYRGTVVAMMFEPVVDAVAYGRELGRRVVTTGG